MGKIKIKTPDRKRRYTKIINQIFEWQKAISSRYQVAPDKYFIPPFLRSEFNNLAEVSGSDLRFEGIDTHRLLIAYYVENPDLAKLVKYSDLAAYLDMQLTLSAYNDVSDKTHRGLVESFFRNAASYHNRETPWGTKWMIEMYHATCGIGEDNFDFSQETQDHAKRARIFEIPASVAESIMAESEELASELGDDACLNLSFPEKLPFDVCYFGYSTPLYTSTDVSGNNSLREFATLVSRDMVVSMMMPRGQVEVTTADGVDQIQCIDGKWSNPVTAMFITLLIDIINDHATVSESEITRRVRTEVVGSITREVPQPFYTTYLKDGITPEIRERIVATRKKVIWNHRWAVEGHYSYRVRRGPSPMSEGDRQWLQDHHLYAVFSGHPPDVMNQIGETTQWYDEIVGRGVSPREKWEWMAIKKYWVSDCIKGPEGKPIVPSIRKSRKLEALQRKLEEGNK